jgi:2-oxoglutarate-Fe(II)-dependent oxygenase superfamily protein
MAAPAVHEVPMATVQVVQERLASITAPGTFATRRSSSADDLRLTVKDVGRVAWPITRATARKLCAVARPARYGLKDETRFDQRVRDCWEIPKSRIWIEGRAWGNTLRPMVDRIRRDLGLADGSRLRAELHNLLVYGPGQFFITHQDSEKTDDMIGTLIVILPSNFTGGAIEIEHHDEKVTFRGSGRGLTFIAFYADCHHRVRPIKAGHRVVLTYNLVVEGDMSTASPASATQVDELARSIEQYFETPRAARWSHDPRREPADRLVYLLDYQYTRRTLGWNRLKSVDGARAAALRQVADRLNCEIFLALADVHETWSCEDEGSMYGGYGGRREWGWRYDEEDGLDDDGDNADALELIDLIDSDIELRHWIAPKGRVEAVSGAIDSDEVCYTKASQELEPFASEHEGYMGNWGNTVDRWYHRAAIVLWPRERSFVIRAKASPGWAIDELTQLLKQGDVERARAFVRRLGAFWTEIAQRERRPRFFERTLVVAQGLDSPELAASLLKPFTLESLTPRAAPRLVGLGQRYGLEWCRAILGSWASEKRRDTPGERQAAWTASLANICKQMCAGVSAQGVELARWLVTEEWTRIVKQWMELRDEPHPTIMRDAVDRMSKPILALLEGSLIANSPELHGDMLRILTSPDGEYPIRGLVHLLRTAHETRSPDALRDLNLASLYEYCRQMLAIRLRMPVREKDNWSIPSPRGCACRLCGTLARFLGASDQVRFEWPLAKNQRAHIHQILDAHDLPVSHTTRRAGSPFTLVLTKTDALFDREVAERRTWERDLAWLTSTARAF